MNDTQMQQTTFQAPPAKSEKRNGVKKLLLVILLLLLLAVGGVYLYKIINPVQDITDFWFDENAINGILAKEDPEDIRKLLETKVKEGMFDVVINATPYFEQGQNGKIGIQNIPGNHYPCTIAITLDDTGEEIYKSAGIKPGQYIDDITLSKKLAAGSYEATAKFTVVSADTYEPIGEVNIKLDLTVLPG